MYKIQSETIKGSIPYKLKYYSWYKYYFKFRHLKYIDWIIHDFNYYINNFSLFILCGIVLILQIIILILYLFIYNI